MGGPRYVALALLAPFFGMPAAAAVAAGPFPSLDGLSAHGQHAVVHRVAADRVVRTSDHVVTRGDVRHGTSRRLSAPAHVRLLAARLYWGSRPPSYPSTSRMHHDLRQTSHYFAQVSRGRQHVHVRLTRWVRVAASGDVMCNTQGRSVTAARAALRRAGYHPGRFNRLMIFTEQCNAAASAAELPGHVSWIRFRAPGMATLVHELGHNMGLEHAYGVVCRQDGRRVALGGACLPVEYGDSWDAMGHSTGSYSAPVLARLGWAGRIQTVRRSGTYPLADVARSRTTNQALRIRTGATTYWVEYQPEHSPQVGRTIPGVMIRRQVGRGPVEMIDASPGNPTGIAYPDPDLTNAALPVGSSLTTPEDIRFTTVATGRHAQVRVTFGQPAAAPDAPVVARVAPVHDGYRVHWTAPADNGQIVLGYRVTAQPSGVSTFVRSPAGYRTTAHFPLSKLGTAPPTFTVKALNQDGWSSVSASDPVPGDPGPGDPTPTGPVVGPDVTVTSPSADAKVGHAFTVSVVATADQQTHSTPVTAWAEIGAVICTSDDGPGPYALVCDDADHTLHGAKVLVVHVRNAAGATTDVSVPVRLHGH